MPGVPETDRGPSSTARSSMTTGPFFPPTTGTHTHMVTTITVDDLDVLHGDKALQHASVQLAARRQELVQRLLGCRVTKGEFQGQVVAVSDNGVTATLRDANGVTKSYKITTKLLEAGL